MEPFGILQFLQSILPKTQTQTPSENGQTEEPPTPLQDEKPSEPMAQTSASQEAIMRFMQAHESRAKRTKRN
ncbi:MAG: hypothetical protein J6U60_03905 [Clostridia bacterium]|nr:hypothetical protein [Clostridia bacterium]